MIRVELRKRKRNDGKSAFYLDYYPPILNPKTGKGKRQDYLKLFVFDNPKGSGEKEYNKEVTSIAKSILSKRINEVNKTEIYSKFEIDQLKQNELDNQDFLIYFKKLGRKKNQSNSKTWISVQKYLESYFPNGLRFGDISEEVIEGFREYLLSAKSIRSENTETKISPNTALSYFNKVKASLKQAFRDKILKEDVNSRVDQIKATDTFREHLTLEELNKLIDTPCQNTIIKKAAIFSALTGLRFSDILKLKGNEIKRDNGNIYLQFTQQKTQSKEIHYIGMQAVELLGNFEDNDEPIFKGLKYSAYANKHLAQWIGLAGIKKNVSFHNFRHTYATLLLKEGVDIYTVSKLLGHKNLKTTQIYAKVVDEKKQNASNVIQLINVKNI